MKSRDRICHIVNSIIIIGYAVTVGLLLLNNVIFGGKEYLFRKDFLLPNILLIILGIALIVIGYFISKRVRLKKHKYTIYILSVVLLLIQCFVYYNILFITHTWDAGTILKDARVLVGISDEIINLDYYSQFPNNIWILGIIKTIVRVSSALGITGLENQLYIIVIIQSIISTATGYLVYKSVEHKTKSNGYALLSWIFYVILVGLSAQAVIPYTDMMSLVFPTLVYRIYQLTENSKNVYIKWFAIVLLSYIGYKIKPTVIIVLVGIVVCEVISGLIIFDKQKWKYYIKIIITVLIAVITGVVINKCVNLIVNIPQNDELNTGPLHMLMMGTNDETNGSFSFEDVSKSLSEPNKETRKQLQLNSIKERIRNRQFVGNLKFYAKKALMVFNDGTFAIGAEGGYYDEVFPDKNPIVSVGLKAWYYSTGGSFRISSTIQQLMWLVILVLNVLTIIINKDKKNAALALSLFGIIIFNLMFEARARYLLIYVPLFVIMAVDVLKCVYNKVELKRADSRGL